LSCLLTRPVAWDGSAAGGTTRPPRSALRELTPIAVSELADQYLMRRVTWRLRRPVAPRERPWFSFGGLQGRLVGSNRGPLFRCKRFGPSYPERGRCAPSPDLPRPDPGPEEHRETNRWHLQRKREIMGLINRCYRSAKIVSNRLEDGSSLNFLWIGGGIAGPGSILRPRTAISE